MNRKKDISEYKDIINLPRHVSSSRPQMSIKNRSAQFAPFAAVVGHGEAVIETARLTDQRIELDETEKSAINKSLADVVSKIADENEIEIVFFVSDTKKDGGKYLKKVAKLRKFDEYLREVYLNDGTVISIDDILHIRTVENLNR